MLMFYSNYFLKFISRNLSKLGCAKNIFEYNNVSDVFKITLVNKHTLG